MQNDTEEGLRMMKDKRKPQDAPKDAIISCRNDYVPIAARRAAEVTGAGNNGVNPLDDVPANINRDRGHSDGTGYGNRNGVGDKKKHQRSGRAALGSKKVDLTRNMNVSSSTSSSDRSLVAAGNGYIRASNVTEM
jgi:hypothetical protein